MKNFTLNVFAIFLGTSAIMATPTRPLQPQVDGSCTRVGNAAQQGGFSTGYSSTFETSGTDLIITFELLDTDKAGVVAFLWQETPFSEVQMDNVEGTTFRTTIPNVTDGTVVSYAAKFAFAGGLAVTEYLQYEIGTSCAPPEEDTTPPANFTATAGTVTDNAATVLVNCTDAALSVTYEATLGETVKTATVNPGVETAITFVGLSPETAYSISATVTDLAGNVPANAPIVVEVTTAAAGTGGNLCTSSGAEAQDGSFSTGYTTSFETVDGNVIVTYELLDTDKAGVVAFLWRQDPFTETPMEALGDNRFSATVSGLTEGQAVNFACKFAFAGGQAVTAYQTYQVGDDCSGAADTEAPTALTATASETTSSYIAVTVSALDNSPELTFTGTLGGTTATTTAAPGAEGTLYFLGLASETAYEISVTVEDAAGNQAGPATVSATTPAPAGACEASGSEAQEGAFAVGYTSSFETVETGVVATYALLDTDKVGVVAFLLLQTPFAEYEMDPLGDNVFQFTVTGLSAAAEVNFACKFAFAGGLATTVYTPYTVGDNCGGNGGGSDVTPPANFTAVAGTITTTSVAVDVSGEDDTSDITFTGTVGTDTQTATVASGAGATLTFSGLTPGTTYEVSVSAADAAGNVAANAPVVLSLTTMEEESPVSAQDILHLEEAAYPNPTTGRVLVRLPADSRLQLSQVVNTQGQQQRVRLTSTPEGIMVDLSSSSAGLYFISLQGPQGTSVVKVVKR